MSRQEANRKLVAIISAIVEQYPDQRFGQILYNISVATHVKTAELDGTFWYKDIFFEESSDTLKRITATQVDISTDSEEID